MTTVHISLGRDDGTTKTAAKGVVEWEPTTRREDGTMVILERGFTVPLVAGEATVTVDPSGLTWCWRVTERTDSGGTVRYVSVPDSAAVVEYVDLPDVDPTTLVAWSPADPEAAYLASLGTAVDDYLTANPVSAPVDSVNGQTGAVALDAADVGADPAGTAAGLVGALVIPDSADDVGAIPEPAVEGASGDVLVTDGAGGRTWATPDAGGVTSVDGQTGAVSLSSTYVAQADLTVTSGASVTGDNTGDEPDASETVKGIVQLATDAQAALGEDTERAVTPAGVKAFVAQYVMVGTGSPYGVITPAGKGVEYIDTAQTLGARKWISTGTTNTSWIVTDGDTGAIDVSSLLVNGWTAGGIYMRRYPYECSLQIFNLSPASATADTFMTIPDGMALKASSYYWHPPLTLFSPYVTGGALRASRTGGALFAGAYGFCSLPTHGRFAPLPWPTSLP